VDAAKGQVLNSSTLVPIAASTGHRSNKNSSITTALISVEPEYRPLLAEFPRILNTDFRNRVNSHGVKHTIETEGRPAFAKARRLNAEKR